MGKDTSKKPLIGANGKPYKLITVEGEEVRPIDAYWVVYDPQGKPLKAFTSTVQLADNRTAAMRSAFHGDTHALTAALDGYKIELMLAKRFLRTIAPKLAD